MGSIPGSGVTCRVNGATLNLSTSKSNLFALKDIGTDSINPSQVNAGIGIGDSIPGSTRPGNRVGLDPENGVGVVDPESKEPE